MDYTKYTDSVLLPHEKFELAIIQKKEPKIWFRHDQMKAYNSAIEYLSYYKIVTKDYPMTWDIFEVMIRGLYDFLKIAFPGINTDMTLSRLDKFFDDNDIPFHIEVITIKEPHDHLVYKVIRWITWKEFI